MMDLNKDIKKLLFINKTKITKKGENLSSLQDEVETERRKMS